MPEPVQNPPIGAADIEAAAKVVAPFAVRTPLLTFPVLNERVGTKVFLKPEMLQRTGSFKFRGAYNKISSIPEDKRAKWLVQAWKIAQGTPRVKQMMHYGLLSVPDDNPSAYFDMGLLFPSGQPRKSFYSLRNWIQDAVADGKVKAPGPCGPCS